MDLNLYIVNTRPFRPQRFCLNRTGPEEVSLMRMAAGNMTSGPKMMRMMVAKTISRIRRTDIQRAVFGYFHQNDSIRNKKDVVDDQHQQNDDSVRGIRIHKRNQNRYQHPCRTYRFRKPADLSKRRHGRLGIDTAEGQQERPGWKGDCKKPEICGKGHDGMPLYLKEQTKAVGKKEARRGQSQIS